MDKESNLDNAYQPLIHPQEDLDQQIGLWVDWNKKIVSLHQVEGYEEKRFLAREDAVAFAITLTRNGFLVQ